MRGIVAFKSLGNYGRMANQMFQIAGTIGIARRNGMEFAFPEWRNLDHKERFGSDEDIDLYKYFVNPLPAIPTGIQFKDRPVDWGYQDVRLPAGNWNLSGHFQSFKYFAHCFDEVKWYLRMKDEYKQNDWCAIHARLGDYDGGYHPRLDWSYYGAAIAAMPKGTRFMLFSDDMEHAVKLFTMNRVEVYPFTADYIEAFKMMRSCRHFIIGNSSYSAMAAILGEAPDKKVIAPAPWFGPNYTKITGKDIYCDDWTVIDWERQKVMI